MEKSSFFNSVNGDRKYDATAWAEYFASFIGNGFYPVPSSGLQVLSGENMRVTVQPGKAWINGYFYINTTKLTLQLDIADGVLKRIDRIVVRWSLANRQMRLAVKKGAFGASPVAPALQRDTGVFELGLADILVDAGATAISQAKITDQRLNPELCGVVAAVVNQIDTEAFNAQLQAWFRDYMVYSQQEYDALVTRMDQLTHAGGEKLTSLDAYFTALKAQGDGEITGLKNRFDSFIAESDAEFQAWFTALKTVLDENAAVNLLNMIQQMGADMDTRIDQLRTELAAMLTTIDCGYFIEDPEAQGVAAHNASVFAHPSMIIDGNANGTHESGSLQDHEQDPYSHPNLVIDGNST